MRKNGQYLRWGTRVRWPGPWYRRRMKKIVQHMMDCTISTAIMTLIAYKALDSRQTIFTANYEHIKKVHILQAM